MSVLYGAVGGAIAGGLGGLIGWGLTALIWADEEPIDRPKWLSAVCCAVLIVLSRPLVHWWETPSVDGLLTTAANASPSLAALKDTGAPEYADVRAAVEQLRSGAISNQEGMELVHAATVKAFRRKIETAPDSLIQLQAQIVGAEYAALEGTPDICVGYIAGTQVVDLRQYLPPNMVAADQDMMSQIIRSPAAENVRVASDTEVQKAAAPILARVASEAGVSPQQVADALDLKGDQRLTCHAFAALFQGLSNLPTAQSAAILRGLDRMSQK
jgi:hypothetical protein